MCGRIAVLLFAGIVNAQPPSRPAFEVATIKLNPNCTGRGGAPAPGRLELRCTTVRNMIRASYSALKGERLNTQMAQVVGGPAWLDSDRYDVSAKAEGAASFPQMMGPMLQTLLEDRFQLKVHMEPRETPVYALTVAKATPKLSPAKEGSCVVLDLNKLPKPGEPEPLYCGFARNSFKAGAFTAETFGSTMEEFAGRVLVSQVDRPVIDKTGLTGRYDIRLEFGRDPTAGPVLLNGVPRTLPEGAAPSIYTALQEQLGLKLVPDKAPIDVIVVDSAQRPSEN